MRLQAIIDGPALFMALAIAVLVSAGCGPVDKPSNGVAVQRATLTALEEAQASGFFKEAMRNAQSYEMRLALAYLDSTLQVDSTHYLAHFQKGLLMRRLSNFDASSAAYRKAVLYNPELFDAWYNLANNAFWQNQFNDAITLFDTLLAKKEMPAFWHNKGRAHLALSEDERALASFEKAVALDSTYAYGHASIGALAEMNGEYAKMLGAYANAVRHEPESDEYWYKLGMASSRNGQLTEAMAYWDSTLVRNPFHFGALFNKGKSLHAEGNPLGQRLIDRAEEVRTEDAEIQRYQRGAERFPEDAYYRHALGNLYAARKQWPEAARAFKLAVALEPQSTRSLINLGNVYVMQNHRELALQTYQSALQVDSTAIDVMQNLAVVSMQLGDRISAEKYWRMILNIDPQHALAQRGLARVGS